MSLWTKSPFGNLPNYLMMTQFLLTMVFMVKGVFTAYLGGASLFDSVFIGGFISNMWWITVPSALFAITLFWPKFFRDIYCLFFIPCIIVLMISVGWEVSGYVAPKDKMKTIEAANEVAMEAKEILRKAKEGQPEYVEVVRRYEMFNGKKYEDYIKYYEDRYQEDLEWKKQNDAKANWGVRFVMHLFGD
jgi:hypothetical protein